MPQTLKPKLLVLKGGVSDEFNLSMQHGLEVTQVLKSISKYEVEEIAVTKSGKWLQQGIARNPKSILEAARGAYIALHGIFGEDGTIQRLLERYGVPYNGSKPFESSIGLHKMLTKENLSFADVTLAPHMRVTREGVANIPNLANTIGHLYGPQYILKPMRGGSGIGNHVASSTIELAQALEQMLQQYDDILVEEFIPGTDATCGIVEGLRGQSLYVTPVVEMNLRDDEDIFTTEKIVPGRFSKAVKQRIEAATVAVHQRLGLKGTSRADFRITPKGEVYFLEVNTLPAVTRESPLMAGLGSFGVSQEELLCHICGQIIRT